MEGRIIMNELEKKFYNWLMLNYCVPIKPEKIAHDLAEIAEKDLKKQKELYLDLRRLDNKNLQEIEDLKIDIEYLEEQLRKNML